MARILEITSYPPPRTGWGVRVEFVKRHLEAAGHRCAILNMGVQRKVPSPEYECVRGGADYVLKILRHVLGGYRVHAHVNGSTRKGILLTIVAEILSLFSLRRAVLTFHAGAEQHFFPRPKSGWMTPAYWLTFLLARRIICNSEAVKEKIREYGVRAGKITPIPAFTRQYLEHREVRFDDDLERFFEEHAPRIFCYVKFRDVFFVDTLVEALARVRERFPSFGAYLVGTIEEDREIERRARAKITEYGLAEHLRESPGLGHDEFRSAMKRCDMYLRTHYNDGVCSSVLEALSFGLPVVAAENGTRPASVVTYTADDPGDMAVKIASVLEDLEAARRRVARPAIRDTIEEEVEVLTTA